MPKSGLLISWATVAASLPMEAIFSELSRVLCMRSSSAVLRRTCSSILACTPPTCSVILLKHGGQVAQFVVRSAPAGGTPGRLRHAVRAVHQLFHRPVHHQPDERPPPRRSRTGWRPAETRSRTPGCARSAHPPGPATIGVHHPQHLLAGGVDVARRAGAFRRVVDGAHHRDQVMALLVPKRARPVRPVELGERLRLRVAAVAGLGRLVDGGVDFPRVGGNVMRPSRLKMRMRWMPGSLPSA